MADILHFRADKPVKVCQERRIVAPNNCVVQMMVPPMYPEHICVIRTTVIATVSSFQAACCHRSYRMSTSSSNSRAEFVANQYGPRSFEQAGEDAETAPDSVLKAHLGEQDIPHLAPLQHCKTSLDPFELRAQYPTSQRMGTASGWSKHPEGEH